MKIRKSHNKSLQSVKASNKIKSSHRMPIKSATSHNNTTFYRFTINQITEYFSKANPWIKKDFDELDWDAIDFSHNLWGSAVIDDELYICDTDGSDIEVAGDSNVNPEDALDEYSIDELEDYIVDGTDSDINKFISEYEVVTPKFNQWASDLLNEGYTFKELVSSYEEFDV